LPSQLERLRVALTGRYAVEREVGRGGMATVFLARDVRHERAVAIKVLRPDLAAALGPERFLREIRIAAALQHPHILPLHDSGVADGLIYYVMPFVAGESLRERLRREGEMPLEDAVRVLRDVAEALAAAHERGIVHRDIKPDNVLLSGRSALVTDFGVARAVSDAAEDPQLTGTGVALGTPAYMAPEQATAGAVDHRADIYAFGVLAFETLTGRPPFEAPSVQGVLAAQLVDEPPDVTSLRATVPSALGSLVMRCLEKRPADRWQTAAEVVAQLERVATPAAGTPPARLPGVRASHWGKRVGWVAGLAVVGALGVLGVRQLSPPPAVIAQRERIAVIPVEAMAGDTGVAGLAGLAADWIRTELTRTLGDAVEVVPALSMARALRYAGGGDSALEIDELARRVGAGTVIAPRVRVLGGRMHLDAEVTDVRSATLLFPVRPMSTARDSGEAAVPMFGERVVVQVGQHFSPRFRWWRGKTSPPSLATFREVEAGLRAFAADDHREAVVRFGRALSLDSLYVEAMQHTWASYWILGMGQRDTLLLQRAEAALTAAEALQDGLSAADRANLRWARAWHFGNLEAEYRAAEEEYHLGGGARTPYAVGLSALRTNRPARAAEVMSAGDPAGTWEEYWPAYWHVYANALHAVDRLDDALTVLDRARARLPDDASFARSEMQLRAARGQATPLHELLDHMLGLHGLAAVPAAIDAARESRIHGHSELADDLLHRVLDWLTSQPEDTRATAGYRDALGRVLYALGDWSEASRLFQVLVAERPLDVDRLGRLGTALARLNERDAALQVAARLRDTDTPYLYGRHTRWQAQIRAALGDSVDAVRLVRQAIEEGSPYGIHPPPEFEGWDAYGPYARVMRPKD
jgi:tetratricopeptide (TPR) repeat protein/TolB-like protein